MIKCEKCGKLFKKNYLLTRHENKKFPCDKIKNIDKQYDTKIEKLSKKIENINKKSLLCCNKCLFCRTTFITKGNLTRHLNNSCSIKKNLVKEKQNLIDEKNILIENKNKRDEVENNSKLKEELKILKDKVEHLESKQQITQNITINNINNNTQNNLVMINPFGKEDLSHLSVEDYKKFLNGFFPGFLKYIEKVHFDENAPQNHNICISNLRSKYLTIHDGDKWVTKMRDDIIERFINKKHNQLIDKREELENLKKIDRKIMDNFDEFCENLENNEAKKSIKNDVITMIYDNKNKINPKIKINAKNENIDISKDDNIKLKKKIKNK